MALVVHEDQVKIILNDKFYIIEGIEYMVHRFYMSSVIYYDGLHLRRFSSYGNKIICTPEPDIINIHTYSLSDIILVYNDKIIYYDGLTSFTYNVTISEYATIDTLLLYYVIYESDSTKLIHKETKKIITFDYNVYNVHSWSKNVLVYARFTNKYYSCSYDLLTGNHISTNCHYRIFEFMGYELVYCQIIHNYDLYFNKIFLSNVENVENLINIDHDKNSVLLYYPDKIIVKILKNSTFETKHNITLYHNVGLNTKSARKIAN